MAKKLTTLTVINQFIEKHGNKYYYFLVDYKGAHSKVDIICPIHGKFEQTAGHHKRGRGCNKCAYEIKAKNRIFNNSQIIQQFIEKHGNKYDYSLVDYKGAHSKVDIICPIHGKFEQLVSEHKFGKGCRKCGIIKQSQNTTLSTSEVISRCIEKHGNKYDYSLVDYKGSHSKVDIICPIHGKFEQLASNHYNRGDGCPKCNSNLHDRNYYKDKKTTLYYLKVNEVYKIGVTTRSVKKRYSADKDVNITILKEWVFEDGAIAHDYEQMIIKYYKQYKYYGKPILEGGNTELFEENILPLFEDKIMLE